MALTSIKKSVNFIKSIKRSFSMAEKQIDKIKRLMNNPEKIRNIGVCAHIDMLERKYSF